MRLKRLVATFGTNFDNFVSKVENHEAVADAMIDDVKAAAAKLTMQKARNAQQLIQLSRKKENMLNDIERWRQRAVSTAENDEARALECVKRLKHEEKQLKALDTQLQEHESLEVQLQQRLSHVEERISELQLKKAALSSRTAKTKALALSDQASIGDVDSVFDRWEESVIKDEYLDNSIIKPVDHLEKTFLETEEMDDLKSALADLRSSSSLTNNDKSGEEK